MLQPKPPQREADEKSFPTAKEEIQCRFARKPNANDRQQAKHVHAGEFRVAKPAFHPTSV